MRGPAKRADRKGGARVAVHSANRSDERRGWRVRRGATGIDRRDVGTAMRASCRASCREQSERLQRGRMQPHMSKQTGGRARARTVCSSRNRDTCGSIASASVSPAPSGCCRGRLQVTKLRLDLRSAHDAVCSDVHRAGQARGRRRKTLSILGARAPAALVEAPATHGCKQERARPAGSARSTEEHHDDSCRAGGSDARSAITEGHGSASTLAVRASPALARWQGVSGTNLQHLAKKHLGIQTRCVLHAHTSLKPAPPGQTGLSWGTFEVLEVGAGQVFSLATPSQWCWQAVVYAVAREHLQVLHRGDAAAASPLANPHCWRSSFRRRGATSTLTPHRNRPKSPRTNRFVLGDFRAFE